MAVRSLTITTRQARAAAASLLVSVCGTDIENADTWHGGLGTDLCEHCSALVVLRVAANYSPTDSLRP